jgi:glycosyltransferase involved in cell wall biosynthesis
MVLNNPGTKNMETSNLPSISIITPSYNQGQFLEQTIDSVLSQGYPKLEYIIVDGGSTDDSVEIIRRYQRHLHWWVSEPDLGQVDAINKGLRHASGEWLGWQNSDDFFLPDALTAMVDAAVRNPECGVVMGGLRLANERGESQRDVLYCPATTRSLLAEGMVIANQSALWHRELHAKAGTIDPALHFAFDYDWFIRILEHTRAACIYSPLGVLRSHGATKTANSGVMFKAEEDLVRSRHNVQRWELPYQQLRRATLLTLNGQSKYVLRGLTARLGKW